MKCSLGATLRLEDIAATYVQGIRDAQPDGPYFLCGNCFGGLVAFEVAQQLQRQDQTVGLLALIDTAFPVRASARLSRHLALERNWRELSRLRPVEKLGFIGTRLSGFAGWIGAANRPWAYSTAVRMAAIRGHTPPRSPLSVFDANQLAQAHYRPQGYSGKIVLFCPGRPDNQLGWKRVARDGLEIIELPCESSGYQEPHLVQEPYVQRLADALRSVLR
jgi:acetoacetyl-CoA synthetase